MNVFDLFAKITLDTSEYEQIDDAEEYFKTTAVVRVLASNIACILAELTMHSQIGPMITSPVCQFPQ